MPRALRRFRLLVPVLLVLPLAVALLATPAVAKKKHEGRQPYRVSKKEAKLVELGRRLFFDPLVSRTGSVACATCHVPDHGFSDPRRFSPDETGASGRHSQPILDTRSNPTSHWDGEFRGGVEELVENRLGRVMVYYGNTTILPPATPRRPTTGGRARPSTGGPLAGGVTTPGVPGPTNSPALPTTPALPSLPTRTPRSTAAAASVPMSEFVAEQVEASGRYSEAFKAAYGSPHVTIKKLSEAMGAYCHSIESTEATFDRFHQGDEEALSASARRGHDLFHGSAGCAQCHTSAGKHALLTDYEFHNTGIAWRALPVESPTGGDTGRMRFTDRPADRRAFKTPTLRDVTRRGPYMHDGSFATLEQVVRYYADGGSSDPDQDSRIRGFEASDQDVQDLVAFLEALEGEERPGLATTEWKARAERTKLRFTNADGDPVASLPVRLVPAGDWIDPKGDRPDAAVVVELLTDAKGWATFEPLAWTHVLVEVQDGLVEIEHPLVPDTLERAEITVPVDRRITIDVVAPNDEFVPPTLSLLPTTVRSFAAQRSGRRVSRAQAPGEMRLRRISRVELKDQVVARYEGWLLSGLDDAELELNTPLLPNTPAALKIKFARNESVARVDLTE